MSGAGCATPMSCCIPPSCSARRSAISSTPNRRLISDSPDAIWAGEYYKKLLRDCSPPGVSGFNWNESQTTFMQGRAAFWLDGVGFAAPLEDRTRSRVAGKVGYAVVPRGPAHHHCAMFGTAFGIAEQSRKKGASWLYACNGRLGQGEPAPLS
jgi:multiple sugar transport system substrate-binding protein